MKLLRMLARLLRRLSSRPYVGRRDRVSPAGERALFDSQIRGGF